MEVMETTDTRTIDTAKDASVDLMTLNKKIVNMRGAVKRAKAQVINKLTRNIADLKKKKGTDEEKAKNLKKAQRYLDEIQSIRNLKDDKITKNAIANVSTFEEVSKSTVSALPRALARLADHGVLKIAVEKFREEHSDWRDLAAYMLIQQTGRKFKAQKQEDKTSISRAENIKASKLMTQAYTEGMFREDGLIKSEIFEQKKRKKDTDDGGVNKTKDEAQSPKKNKGKGLGNDQKNETKLNNVKEQKITSDSEDKIFGAGEEEKEDRVIENGDDLRTADDEQGKDCGVSNDNTNKQRGKLVQTSKTKDVEYSHRILDKSKQVSDSDNESEEEGGTENEDDVEEDGHADSQDESEESKEEDDDNVEEQKSDEEQEEVPEPSEPPMKIRKRNDECVVKQFSIGSRDSGDESVDEDEVVSSSSEDEEVESDESEVNSEGDDDDADVPVSKRQLKKSKQTKEVPDFLTGDENKPRRLPKDPFFEGGEMEEGDEDFDGDDNEEYVDDGDDSYIQDKFSRGNKQTTKSLFHRPGEKRKEEFSDSRTDFVRGRGRGGQGRGGGPASRGRGGFDSSSRSRGGGRGFQGGRNSYGEIRAKRSDSDRSEKKTFANNSSNFTGSNSFGSRQAASSAAAPKPAEKLHPSWEASRKRKSEQSGIKAFSGTKTTFDD